jgi:hypothetical protein
MLPGVRFNEDRRHGNEPTVTATLSLGEAALSEAGGSAEEFRRRRPCQTKGKVAGPAPQAAHWHHGCLRKYARLPPNASLVSLRYSDGAARMPGG